METSLPEGAESSDVFFTNARGERLHGTLVDTGSPEVVILCHGYAGNQTMSQFPALAAALAREGLSSFRFDHPCAIYFPCTRKTQSQRKGPFLMGNHMEEVQDMADAAAHMRALGKQGGLNAVLYASTRSDIPRVVNLSGRFDVRGGFLQRYGEDMLERLGREGPISRQDPWGEWWLDLEDVRGRTDLDMEQLASSVPPSVHMLIMHGKSDTTIPWEEAVRCAELVPSCELLLVEGANHNYESSAAATQMIQHVVRFAKGA